MPTSKELLEMADTEWKNREERKGIHNQLCSETRRISWVSGWISGYLTRNPQAEREKVLDELLKRVTEIDHSGECMGGYQHECCRDDCTTCTVEYVVKELREGKDGE
jgi:hypothetical protein